MGLLEVAKCPTGTIRKHSQVGHAARHKAGSIAKAAAAFFRSGGRSFPWRSEADPYKLAIAEILLQKTRAESVVQTYVSLTSTYPDARALACASQEDLSVVLTPLGLSRKRSAMLVAMANAVVLNGPNAFSDVNTIATSIPGLGAYAARAIACFAIGENVGIVDANVARIIRRAFGVRNDDHRAGIFQRYADAIAASENPARDVNFGLLDIGAAFCLSTPRCEGCPLAEACTYGRRQSRTTTSAAARG